MNTKKLFAGVIGLALGFALIAGAAVFTSDATTDNDLKRVQISLQGETITYSVAVTTSGVAYAGTKIYDFPEGRVLVHGVVADVKVSMATVSTGWGGDMGLGTAAVTDGDLTDGTDVDLCAAIAVDPVTNGVSAWQGQLAAAAQFDGTTTAKDMYLNLIIDDADIATNDTATVNGQITLIYSVIGDY